jgi:hypothetical protein
VTEPLPKPGDRVRVTYEGVYVEPTHGSGNPMILVQEPGQPLERWHDIVPSDGTIEVIPPPKPKTLAERFEALADQLDHVPWTSPQLDVAHMAARMIREELAAHEQTDGIGEPPVPPSASNAGVFRSALIAAMERHATHPPRIRLDPDGIYHCPACGPYAPTREQP